MVGGASYSVRTVVNAGNSIQIPRAAFPPRQCAVHPVTNGAAWLLKYPGMPTGISSTKGLRALPT